MSEHQFCFSCHDQMMFQLIGQTADYNPSEIADKYIQHYLKLNLTSVHCSVCDTIVKYEKQQGEKWSETEVTVKED